MELGTNLSSSANNNPSEARDCVESLPDSMTLMPSLYAKYLLTCIGTCIDIKEICLTRSVNDL